MFICDQKKKTKKVKDLKPTGDKRDACSYKRGKKNVYVKKEEKIKINKIKNKKKVRETELYYLGGKDNLLKHMNTRLGFPSRVGQCKPPCHSPKTIKKSWSRPLLDSRRQEISLIEGTLVLK